MDWINTLKKQQNEPKVMLDNILADMKQKMEELKGLAAHPTKGHFMTAQEMLTLFTKYYDTLEYIKNQFYLAEQKKTIPQSDFNKTSRKSDFDKTDPPRVDVQTGKPVPWGSRERVQ